MVKKIDNILVDSMVEKHLLSQNDVSSIIKEAEASGGGVQEILVKRGLVSEKEILKILSDKLGLSCVDLKGYNIDKSVLDKVPVKIASYYKFMPLKIKDRILTVAVSTPLDIKIQDEIRTQLGYEIDMVLSCSDDILESLQRYYGLAAETLDKIVSRQISEASPLTESAPFDTISAKVEDIEKLAEDASVIRLVNQIILEGWRKRATDIHIEPHRGRVNLRYRIDGLLYDAPVPPELKNFLNAIISRIKIMSNLNIVERRLPQDGRAIVRVQNQELDLRIATVPTPFGESVVIRILPTQMLFSLEKLGLSKKDLQTVGMLIQRPHGIIFVTGPTGSGKTTTLYACLNRINTRERKIITIEDPIEYEMPGITQIQVMPEIGLDFARGLRSILRQDPDIMMVGEVRDLETAEIAIRFALTGHLIFSTLHTNDAASGITRLIDIGVEPYLVASSVEAFIAQRLIRVICPECKQEDTSVLSRVRELIAEDLGMKSSDIKIYKGKGCPNCNFTGFYGRTAIYEILLIDEEIRDLISQKVPSNQIKKVAISKGMRTLYQDGWQKVLAGITTPEEVMKVTFSERHFDIEEIKTASQVSKAEPSSLKSNEKSSERRIYKRLSSKVNVKYNIFDAAKEGTVRKGYVPELYGVTKNISAGGILFVSNEPLTVGSILELKIELPDGGEPIECLARVVRIEELVEKGGYDVAVCFLDATGYQRTRINKFVEEERD